MEVYIEYVIFDNLIMDYLILFFTKLILNSKIKTKNMLISTLLGVVCAVFMPLVSINFYIMILLKLLLGMAMVIILKKYNNIREFLTHLLLFFTFTFVFGGLCFAVSNMLNVPVSGGGLLINGYEIPMGIFMLLLAVYVYFMVKLVQYIRHKNKYINYYFDVEIKIDGKSHFLRGYLDSGNKLYDNQTQLPVVVISFKSFCGMFKNMQLQNYLLEKTDAMGLKGAHYLNVNNVMCGGKMLVFEVDAINISNNSLNRKNEKVLLGVSERGFGSEYECLLHSEFLKG